MSATYGAVDAAADPGAAADWQERVDAWPAVRAYKARTHARCAGAGRILDVGAGTGVDLAALGGRAVGVDRSMVMSTRAAARGCTVAVADAHALPFAAATFDAVRADRTLQHLAEPARALDEFVRVLRPGGRLVVADPDQGSLVIEVPGVPAGLVATMRRLRRDVHYRGGTLVRRVPRLLHERGLDGITVEAETLVLTDPADAFGIATWGDDAARSGAIRADEARAWHDALASAGHGFLYAVTFFVVSGRRPGSQTPPD